MPPTPRASDQCPGSSCPTARVPAAEPAHPPPPRRPARAAASAGHRQRPTRAVSRWPENHLPKGSKALCRTCLEAAGCWTICSQHLGDDRSEMDTDVEDLSRRTGCETAWHAAIAWESTLRRPGQQPRSPLPRRTFPMVEKSCGRVVRPRRLSPRSDSTAARRRASTDHFESHSMP